MDRPRTERMIAADEGRKRKAYKDTLGFWTIGIGHKSAEVVEGLEWDDAKIDSTFAADFDEKNRQAVATFPWFARLNDARRAVVIAMLFQMGLGKVLGFKKALAAMRDDRWHDAAGEMLDSKWAKLDTPARARRTARQMETGEWQTA